MATKKSNTKGRSAAVSKTTKTRSRNVGRASGITLSMAELVGIAASAAVNAVQNAQNNSVSTIGSAGTNGSKRATSGDSRPGRRPEADSGLTKAREVFARMKGKPRAEVVSAFKDLGIKDRTANAYFHLIENQSPDAKQNRVARGGRKVAKRAAA